MIWKICYIISVTILVLSILVHFWLFRIKKSRLSAALKPLFAGFSVGVFTLLLPIQLDTYGVDITGVCKSLLTAANRTLRAFVLTDISFMSNNQSITDSFYPVYSVTLMLLCFACPFISLGYILTFFSKLKASLRFALSRRRDICVFSELNEGSLALAQDISKNHPSRRMVFCGVTDGSDENLINSAERIRAVCFTKDILSVNFQVQRKGRQILLFTISGDEQKNTNDALELLSKFRERDGVGLYLFSTLTESSLMLSDVSHGKVRVRRIAMPQNLIYRVLYDHGELLFQGAEKRPDGTRRISAVIVGLGSCGTEMLKALIWYCQMSGYTLTIDGFDRRRNAEDQIKAKCPDIIDPRYNGAGTPGDADYTVRIHSGVETTSAELDDHIAQIAHPTFVFVALGDDSTDIDVSLRLRTLFERRALQPEIFTVIRNIDKKKMLEGAKNHKGQEYRIRPIGDDPSSYTEQKVLRSEIEQEALALHREWGEEESFWRYEYYYQSSVVRAIHSKATASRFPAAGALSEQQKQEIAETEHRRWNAYMRTQGYSFSGSTDPASRNDLARLHNDLVPFGMLPETEKKKDDDNR